MTRWKRLVRDYERRIDVSKAMIHEKEASDNEKEARDRSNIAGRDPKLKAATR